MRLAQINWGLKGLMHMPNVHPLFVHFPIALLLTSLAFYIGMFIFNRIELVIAAKWMLYMGTIAAAVTVWTGLRAMNSVSHGSEVHQMMEIHKYFGYSIILLSTVLSIWVFAAKDSFPVKLRWLFISVFVILALIIVQSGDIGGRMVFLKGVAVQNQEPMDSHAHTHGESGFE